MNKVRCVTFITSIAMLAGATIFSYPADVSAQNSQQDMRDITTMELVKDMGVGINLGNTLESCGDWIA
ncbi:MAG: glycoside hydrolase family 5 protein, partial [Oscillospiraceae bacterium]|nr:glycoside hydrolase family 5 protein [Oscillospiraceae bacterium]